MEQAWCVTGLHDTRRGVSPSMRDPQGSRVCGCYGVREEWGRCWDNHTIPVLLVSAKTSYVGQRETPIPWTPHAPANLPQNSTPSTTYPTKSPTSFTHPPPVHSHSSKPPQAPLPYRRPPRKGTAISSCLKSPPTPTSGPFPTPASSNPTGLSPQLLPQSPTHRPEPPNSQHKAPHTGLRPPIPT